DRQDPRASPLYADALAPSSCVVRRLPPHPVLCFVFTAHATTEIYTLSLHDALPILDTPIIFIEARINLSRFVVTGCAAKTSATVTFPSLNLISLFAFCFNIWLNGVAS